MECPSDLLKSECKSTEARKKNSQNMALLGLGIASKSGVSFSAGSTTTSTTMPPPLRLMTAIAIMPSSTSLEQHWPCNLDAATIAADWL